MLPFPALPPTERPADLTQAPRLNGLSNCSYLCIHSNRELINGIPWAGKSTPRPADTQHWYTCCKLNCRRLRPELRGTYCCIKCWGDTGHTDDCDCREMIIGNMDLPQPADTPSRHQITVGRYRQVYNELLPEPASLETCSQRCNFAVFNVRATHDWCKISEPGMLGVLRDGPARCELRVGHRDACICTRCRQDIQQKLMAPQRAARIVHREALEAGHVLGAKFCTQRCDCNRAWSHAMCCGGATGTNEFGTDGYNQCCFLENHEPYGPHRCAACRTHKQGAGGYLQPWVEKSAIELVGIVM